MRERHVDVLGLLHVDAEERAELAGPRGEPLDVRVCDFVVEGEAEVGELERHIRLQLLRDEPFEDLLVLVRDCRCASGVGDRLSEERRVGMEPCVVQLAENSDALVERLAGDESRRTDAPAVALHEPLEPGALRCVEDCCARKRRDGLPGVGHAEPSLPLLTFGHVPLRAAVSSATDPGASPRGHRTGRPCGAAPRSRALRVGR